MNNYSDIINLPHHVSTRHPQMSKYARAAQFAPFAALNGYGYAISETARLTNSRIELDEEIEASINEKLNIINSHILEKPEATFTYYIPDKRKRGGSYSKITSNVKHIDLANNIIILSNNKKINILDIINIET